MRYELTEEEWDLVVDHRKTRKALLDRLHAQSICSHNFVFMCHCHNDDAYECTKCQVTEYR